MAEAQPVIRVTANLPIPLARQLEAITKTSGRTKTDIIIDALEEYFQWRENKEEEGK